MKKVNYVVLFFGVAMILLAPLFGNRLSIGYLRVFGGMETDEFLQIMDGSIRSFQIIGALVAAYGLFGRKDQENRA